MNTITVNAKGVLEYQTNGVTHRENGPAILPLEGEPEFYTWY